VYGGDDEIETYADLAKAFTKNNPNTIVSIDRAPDSEAARRSLEAGFADGNPPDVFLMEHQDLPALMAEQRVQPVDGLLEDRQVDFGDGFQRDALEAFSADSALQCMPHDVSPLVVYYNERLLNLRSLVEGGDQPPTAEDGWTWDQFVQAAAQMTRGRTKGVYIEPTLPQIAPFVVSAGGELVDDVTLPTTLTFSDEGTRDALGRLLVLARDPRLTPTRTELRRSSALDRFKNGRLGMILGTRALTPELRTANHLAFEVMPLPNLGRYRTITSMRGYCVSSETENLEAAADFLAFAVGREGAAITSTGGFVVPSNLEVAYSPAFTQPGQEPANWFVFNEGVRRADPMPLVRQWPDLVEQVRPLLERMFYSPVIDLGALTEQIDLASQPILAPEEASPVEE